jgi:beta-lactamase regulating signal transducer with metallopeptidase domain
MKEYRGILIGLGLVGLVLTGTYFLYVQERRHQQEMRELARHRFDVESDVLSSQGEADLDVMLYFPNN